MAGDELDQFVREMLEAKKLSGVTEDVQRQLMSDLKQRLLDQINKALIDALPDEKMDEFEQLLDDETIDDARIQQFIVDAGVDVKRVTTVTMLRFYDMYVTPSSGGEKA